MLRSAGRHVTVQPKCDLTHNAALLRRVCRAVQRDGRRGTLAISFWSGACFGYGVVQGSRGGAASGRAVFPDFVRLGEGVRPGSVSMTAFGIVPLSVVVRER